MSFKQKKPDNREYTFMLVPHGGEKVFSIKLPIKTLKIAAGVLMLCGVMLLGIFLEYGYTVKSASADKEELDRLRQINSVQHDKLDKLSKEAIALQEDLQRLNQLENDVRRLLNAEEQPNTSRSGITRSNKTAHNGKGGPVTVKDINQLETMLKEIREGVTAKEGSLVDFRERLTARNERIACTPSIWPTSGEVTSRFGWRSSPWGWGSDYHPGIDIANDSGTPIVAAADGYVIYSGWGSGYGYMVEIDHGNGLTTVYGHCSRLVVNVGQRVKKGEVISFMGSTGISTGPHLHYEVRANGTAVDPSSFL